MVTRAPKKFSGTAKFALVASRRECRVISSRASTNRAAEPRFAVR